MKQVVILFIGLWLLCGCSFAQSQLKNKELQEFAVDISSANTKLKGKLLLFGQFKNDLSSLTFDRYLQLLKENESVSDKGIAEAIRKADQHLFTASKNTFSIAIYSKERPMLLFMMMQILLLLIRLNLLKMERRYPVLMNSSVDRDL